MSAERWFRELENHGFIRRTKAASLGFDGHATATYWRLTEIGYMGKQPTKDYKQWQPGSKSKSRTENWDKPSRQSGRGGPDNRDDRPDNEDGFGPK